MGIRLESEATVYDKYSIARKFLAQNTEINLVQGSIDLIVSKSEIEQLKNGDTTIFSQLTNVELGLASINMAVASSVYQDIGGVLTALTQASAEIKMIPGQIELATSAGSLVSKINMAPDSVKIDAKNIALTGNGLIEILNTGTTRIAAVESLSNNLANNYYTKSQIEVQKGQILIEAGTNTAAKLSDYYTKASIDVKTSSLESSISLKVSRGNISSEISQEAGAIAIRSNRLTIDSDNFKLTPTSAELRGSFYSVQKSAWESAIGVKISDGKIECYRNGSSLESYIDFSGNYDGEDRRFVIGTQNSGMYFYCNNDIKMALSGSVRITPRLYVDAGLTVTGGAISLGALTMIGGNTTIDGRLLVNGTPANGATINGDVRLNNDLFIQGRNVTAKILAL